MLKKTINYTDFNGDPVTEDLFFHLSQAELVEIEVDFQPDGLAVGMQKMMDAQDGKGIVYAFKDIILKSYGKKSSDGRRFIKNSLIREEFESSKAWETIFMELITNPDSMNEFVRGIIPPELMAQAEALSEQAEKVELKPVSEKLNMTQALEKYSGVQISEKIVSGELVIVDE